MPQTSTDAIFLMQTDTTVGFLSQNAKHLETVKSRLPGKQFLKVYASLDAYTSASGRVPLQYKRHLRHAKQTTFIIKGEAFRIVASGPHHHFLKPYGWMYSTSANRSGEGFDRDYCEAHADVIVEDSRGLYESSASTILKLGRTRCRRLR